ncbi:hypothetical protein ACLOJK_034249 [Asimina triloba]
MAALKYLESERNAHPELADWYNSLADLYEKKLWHQLTVKLEQFVALAVFQGFVMVLAGINSLRDLRFTWLKCWLRLTGIWNLAEPYLQVTCVS